MVKKPTLLILLLVAANAAGLMVYAQTMAFAWDEGFHLLAAQLVLRGKRPYIDFFFPQTPLNAYWNAVWMGLFGDTWRTAHAVAAVMVALAVLLVARFLLRRFPVASWRVPAAIVAIFVVGLNTAIVTFGMVGQAYGLCLFAITGAFCCVVRSAERHGLLLPAAAGLLASAAANASLLTAPVGPILLVWMWIYNTQGSRWPKIAAYIVAAIIPTLPLLNLFIENPWVTRFNVFDYHFFYRKVEWDGAVLHDVEVMLAWLDSAQALVLAILSAVGLWFAHRRSGWDRGQRSVFYLCAVLAVAECAYIATAHPNFPQYYMFAVPFLVVLACAGLYAIATVLGTADRPARLVACLCALISLDVGKSVFEQRDDMHWRDQEDIAAQVDQITPADGVLLADEPTYFLTRRTPYPGAEMADSHKLSLPPAESERLHIMPRPELDKRIKAGVFDTIVIDDADRIEDLGLKEHYAHSQDFDDTWVFWSPAR